MLHLQVCDEYPKLSSEGRCVWEAAKALAAMRTDDWPAHCDRREGYTLTTDYDLFDRVTRVTYPDQTYEALTYTAWTSRLGATVTDE